MTSPDPRPPTAPPINIGPDRVARAVANPGGAGRGRSPQMVWRQGTLTGIGQGVATVTIGADPTPVDGVRYFPFTVANVGDTVWLLLNDTDVFLFGRLAP